jgi:hypothetical protein
MLISDLPSHLRDQWPYAPKYARVNVWRMHFIDECWMIEGGGAPWSVEDLDATGKLYRIPAAQ